MFAAGALIVITILCMAHLYLKSSTLRSFATVIAAVVGAIAALGYYEIAADILISKARGGQWAQPGIFAAIFIVAFALTRECAYFLLPHDVEFGELSAHITGVVCGVIVGVVISGVLFIALALCPLSDKWPYARFEQDNINIAGPKSSLLDSDGIVAGVFGWISRGSMSSGKSFSVLHADFINQLHLNRHKAREGVYMITAADSIVVPKKGGIRIADIGGRSYTIVRMGIKSGEIDRGGAMDKDGKVSFTLSQIRIVCKKKAQPGDAATGSGHPFYPKGRIVDNEFKPASLSEIVEVSRGAFEVVSGCGRVAWFDLAFSVPSDMRPILLEFKQNAVVQLPRATAGTDASPADTGTTGGGS
ncbi:MAG: hypothetical protein DRP65_03620 [Planctomycetota bacterium]|nr:MAG: hypothetical protein DRP65_03620 [Planctomycetota bacterium]